MLKRSVLVAVALLVTSTGSAQASTVSVKGTSVLYRAAVDETNKVDALIDASTGTVTISDAGAPISPGPGCTAQIDDGVLCQVETGEPYLDVLLRDNDDQLAMYDYGRGAGHASGGPGDDVINVGSSAWGDYDVAGEAGDDTLRSSMNGAGTATMHGGPGADTLSAKDAGPNVRMYGDQGADVLTWAPFTPVLIDGGAGDDRYLPATRPPLDLTGLTPGPGQDTLDLSAGVPGVTVDLARCAGCVEHVVGSPGNDSIAGTDAGEAIEGGDGNDNIDPRGGRDVVFGGRGDDTIALGDGKADVAGCGEGIDTIVSLDVRDILADDCEDVAA